MYEATTDGVRFFQVSSVPYSRVGRLDDVTQKGWPNINTKDLLPLVDAASAYNLIQLSFKTQFQKIFLYKATMERRMSRKNLL